MKKWFTIIAIVAAAAVILAGCGGGGGGGGNTLTGKVIDGSTSKALPGVRVALGGSNTTTGSDGSFRLTGLSTGSGTLTAQLTGYEIGSVSVTITSGSNTLSDPIKIALVSGNPPDVTPRTLQGTITLTGESNASGVTVTLLSGTTTYEQKTTSSDGKYYFWAPAGTYKLRAAKSGFITKEQSVTISDLTKVVTVNLTLAK
ncbi:MAG: carboxypeptidase regulatory-like domain-containing protein [Armatimonadota bacterium]